MVSFNHTGEDLNFKSVQFFKNKNNKIIFPENEKYPNPGKL